MIHDKLKKIIFNKLYKDLSKVEIIHLTNTIWFIDREDKYWYFEYETCGNLYWRYDFFISFFSLFSLERSEFESIMSEWVEEVLKCVVNTTKLLMGLNLRSVEQVLNCKVNTTFPTEYIHNLSVEQALNCKVNTMNPGTGWLLDSVVEQVLKCEVHTTGENHSERPKKVEEVLNLKVNTTHSMSYPNRGQVEEVLNLKS